MKTLGTKIILLALVALMVGVAGCSRDDSNPLTGVTDSQSAAKADELDIVDTAIDAGAFETLVAAVGAADLVDALRGDGPLTVFAPTDDAFAKLPEGLVEQLLQPRNKAKLQELLLYHVVAGEYYSGDLRRWQFTETLNGKYLWIRKYWGGRVYVNNAKVVIPNVGASNGVIHAIDTVLIPKGFELEPEEATLDIVDTAAEAGAFNTLLAAAGAAELVDALRGEDPLTVFAPTDDAFAKLPQDLVAALLLPENKAKLQELLLYHVVAGQVTKSDLKYYQWVDTLSGSKLRIIKWFGNVWVNYSKVTTPDVLATNGVIHVINKVLIPMNFSLETKSATWDKAALDTYGADKAVGFEEAPPSDFDLKYLESSN